MMMAMLAVFAGSLPAVLPVALSVALAAQAAPIAAAATPAVPVAGMPGASAPAPIIITIGNVRNNHGTVRVMVCPQARFLSDVCPFHGEASARAGFTEVTIAGVPPGAYAVQAFHDENDNQRLDRGLMGIPHEGVGFSRDAKIAWGPPKWGDAMFSHGAAPQTIGLAMRYFTGPASPEAWARAHPTTR